MTDQTEREALIDTLTSGGADLGMARNLAWRILAAGFHRTPTPHVVTTVEELRHLDGHALRLRCGWIVVVEVLDDSTNFVHGDHVTDVLVWLNENDGEGLFPATVLTPAPALVDREVLVEKVARAIAEEDYVPSGGGSAWEAAPDLHDSWRATARAALDAIEGVSRG